MTHPLCYFLLATFLTVSANAATLIVSISTSAITQSSIDRPVSVTSEDFLTVDLNDRAGLIPGTPIRLTLGPVAAPFPLWFGNFRYQEGQLRFDFNAILGVSAEGWHAFKTTHWNETRDPVCPCFGASGYIPSQGLDALELVVPWETDLSQIRISLAQHSTIAGNQAYFNRQDNGVTGTVAAWNMELTSRSVPEPPSLLFLLLTAAFGQWRVRPAVVSRLPIHPRHEKISPRISPARTAAALRRRVLETRGEFHGVALAHL